MKLHLPKGLRAALLACLCAICIASTSTSSAAESISINFAGNRNGGTNREISSDATEGLEEVRGEYWNQVTGATGTQNNLTIYTGDTSTLTSTATVTWSSANTYDTGNNTSSPVLYGYIDDGSGVNVTVGGLDFLSYNVYIYTATDTAGVSFSAKTVNGVSYTANTTDATGAAVPGSAVWGDSNTRGSLTLEKNALLVENQTDSTLQISSVKNGTARGCIAGVQIVSTYEGDVYRASLSEDATWTGVLTDWNNSDTSEHGTYASFTVNNTEGVTLTLDADATTDAIFLSGGNMTIAGSTTANTPSLAFVNAGRIDVATGNTLTMGSNLALSGAVTLAGGGTVSIVGAELSNLTSITVSKGTSLSLAEGSSAYDHNLVIEQGASVTHADGTFSGNLHMSAVDYSAGTYSSLVTASKSLTLEISSGTLGAVADYEGAGGITVLKTGSGTATIGGNNAGKILKLEVQGGTLNLTEARHNSITSVHIASGATLRLNSAGANIGADSASSKFAMTMDAESTFAMRNGNGGGVTYSDVTINAAGSYATIAGSYYGGNANLSGTITGVGTLRLTDDAQGNSYTVSATISDKSASEQLAVLVTKNSGSASVVLSGRHTYTGGTTVNNAQLTLSHSGEMSAIVGNLLVENNGTLVTSGDSLGWGNKDASSAQKFSTLTLKDSTWNVTGNNFTLSDVTIVLENSVVNLGTSFDVFTGVNTFSTTADATETSVFTTSSDEVFSLRAGNDATAAEGAEAVFDIARGDFTLDATNTSDLRLDVVIGTKNSGNLMPLDKRGDGVLELTRTNEYTSGTIIRNGTILLSAAGSLGSGGVTLGDTTANTKGTLEMNRSSDTVLSSAVTGSGTITHMSDHALVLGSGSSIANTVTLQLNSGTLGSTDNYTLYAPLVIGVINGTSEPAINTSQYDTSTGVFGQSARTITVSGAVTLNSTLQVQGDGVLKLTGDVAGGGGISVTGGSLLIGGGKNSTTKLETGNITIGAANRLDIHHASGVLTTDGTTLADLTMSGGSRLHLQDMDASASNITAGKLTSTGVAGNTVSYTWKGGFSFTELTGDADITFEKTTGLANTESGEDDAVRTTTFGTLRDYNGTISVASGSSSMNHTLVINGATQSINKKAEISCASESRQDFIMSGEGEVSFSDHTAKGFFTIQSGTVTAGKLTLAQGAYLELHGGVLNLGDGSVNLGDGVTNYGIHLLGGIFGTDVGAGVTITPDVTLGEVTLGSPELSGALTLAGNVDFAGTATYIGNLTISGDIVISPEGLAALQEAQPQNGTYTDKVNNNGYLTGTYTILTRGEGSSASFIYGSSEEPKTTISVAGMDNIELSIGEDGAVSFTLGDGSNVYYINTGVNYDSNLMSGASTFYVAKDQTLTFGKNAWGKNLDLAGGTVSFTNESMNAGSDKLVTLHSTDTDGDGVVEYSNSTITMSNSTLAHTIGGVGNLVLERHDGGGGQKVFYVTSAIQHDGDLTLRNGVEVQSAASINNTGVVKLEHNTLDSARIGSNVTGLSLADGTLTASSALAKPITLAGGDNTIHFSSKQNINADISGSGNLTLDGAANVYKSISHTGDLTLRAPSDSEEIDLNGARINNSGKLTIEQGRIALWGSGASIGSNVTQLVINGGRLEVDPNIAVNVQSLLLTGDAASSQLKLKNAISVSGAVELLGGTLSSTVDQVFAQDVTLGGVTIGGVDGFKDGAITIGAEGTTTTFVGTVTNQGSLTILGTLQVQDLTDLAAESTDAYTDGDNGFIQAGTYTLVRNEGTDANLTLDATTVQVVGYSSPVNVEVADGVATFTLQDAGAVYYVNKGDVSYSAITGSETTATGIALNGGQLSGVSGEVAMPVAVMGNTTINAAGGDTANSAGTSLTGTIGTAGTGGDLTIASSGSGRVDVLATVDLGENSLIVAENSTVRLGNLDNENHRNLNVTASAIEVKSGATLDLHHGGGDLSAGVRLSGGTLHATVIGKNGEGALNFGGLEVAEDSEISGTYGGEMTFTSLTGSGDLTVVHSGAGGNDKRNVEVAVSNADYSGKLTAGDKAVVTVAGGTLSGGAEVSDSGKLVLNSAAETTSGTALRGTLTIKTAAADTALVATLAAGDSGNAVYKGVTITNEKLSGGSLSGASVTVSQDFALDGVSVTDCSFDLRAALTVGATSGIDAASGVSIAATGTLIAEGSLDMGDTGNSLMLDVTTQGPIVFDATGLALTSTQLQGDISGTFCLEASDAFLAALANLENGATMKLTFNTTPGTSSAQLVETQVSGSEASPIALLTADMPEESALISPAAATYQTTGSGLNFVLGDSFAGTDYRLVANADGSYSIGAAGAIPEPTTATLSLLALAALAARRRRK